MLRWHRVPRHDVTSMTLSYYYRSPETTASTFLIWPRLLNAHVTSVHLTSFRSPQLQKRNNISMQNNQFKQFKLSRIWWARFSDFTLWNKKWDIRASAKMTFVVQHLMLQPYIIYRKIKSHKNMYCLMREPALSRDKSYVQVTLSYNIIGDQAMRNGLGWH